MSPGRVLVGMWLAILGYGLAFTGASKLGTDPTCTLGKAFRGQCRTTPAGTGGPATGRTVAQRRQDAVDRQFRHLTVQPVIRSAGR